MISQQYLRRKNKQLLQMQKLNSEQMNEDQTQQLQQQTEFFIQKQTNKQKIMLVVIAILTMALVTLFIYIRLHLQDNRLIIRQKQYYQFMQEQNTDAINVLTQQIVQANSLINKTTEVFNVTSKQHKHRQTRTATEKDKFLVPKIIWLYLDQPAEQQTYIVQKNIENIKYYAQLSGFELRRIGRRGYEVYLPTNISIQLTDLIARFQHQRQNDEQLNSKFEKVRQTLIELYLFRQFGGVVISKHYLFTETLDWLADIKANILLNTGNPGTTPSYFAFFSILYGPAPAKHNKKVENEVDKYMVISPAIKDVFLAGVAGGQYIKDLLTKYIEFIEHYVSRYRIVKYIEIIERCRPISWIVKRDGFDYGKLDEQDLNNALTIASHRVIFSKQSELTSNNQQFEGIFDKFAIDQYGLFTMNTNYFADKIKFYFNNSLHSYDNNYDNFYNYLAKLPLDQFQDCIGPMRYIANPDPFQQFNSRVQSAVRQQGKYSIVEGSFIHKYLFLEQKHSFIEPNKEKRNSYPTYKKWTSLPKILWLYWDKGFDDIPISLQFILTNLVAKAEISGYKVIKVSDQNYHLYIPPQTLKRIESVIKAKKMQIQPQTKSDFYRLALVSNHGGMYLDCTYIFLQNFTWINQIANEQTQFIFNRFGDVPKVFLQFHTIQGAPFDWQVNKKYNTKVAWHLAYQNNFLVADKGSQFMKDWFDQFLWFANSTYEETENRMKECGTFDHKWTFSHDRYLTAMDSLKANLGCKQIQINKNRQKYGDIEDVNDYYKLWAINGFTGIQKYRFYNSYANYINDHYLDNVMIYRYSKDYAEEVHGPVYKIIKFYAANYGPLNDFIIKNRDNLLMEAHPDSIFMQYVVGTANNKSTLF